MIGAKGLDKKEYNKATDKAVEGAVTAVVGGVIAELFIAYKLFENNSPSTETNSSTPAQPQPQKVNSNEIKSKSEGTQGGPRAGKPFTPKGKIEVWKENNTSNNGTNVCENCGVELAPSPQSQKGVATPENAGQVDHIWPKSKGGDGDPSNGQLLCPWCNNVKSNDLPIPKSTVPK